MVVPIILASGSAIRAQLLTAAGITFTVQKPRVDEETIKASLLAEGHKPRDVADALAEAKASKAGSKAPEAFTIGSDQVLVFQDRLISKSKSQAEAQQLLQSLRGQTHQLVTAAAIYNDGKIVWRQVTSVKLTMRDFSDSFLASYLDRNWDKVSGSVGAYHLEEEGIRLFSRIDGDHFCALGFPLLPVLSYLSLRGVIAS